MSYVCRLYSTFHPPVFVAFSFSSIQRVATATETLPSFHVFDAARSTSGSKVLQYITHVLVHVYDGISGMVNHIKGINRSRAFRPPYLLPSPFLLFVWENQQIAFSRHSLSFRGATR